MKKFLAILMSMIIVGSCMTMAAGAGQDDQDRQPLQLSGAFEKALRSETNYNGFEYTLSSNSITITGLDEEIYKLNYPKYENDHVLMIPESIDGYKVVQVGGMSAGNKSYSFTKVVIPKGVKRINRDAFRNNAQLQEVELEEGSVLEGISYGAFYNCINLKRIGIGNTDALPETLSEMGSYGSTSTFGNCRSLTSIDLSACKLIYVMGFEDCVSLQIILFPQNLDLIYSKAFSDCESLQEVSFPATLRKIERSAFANCISLKRVLFETYEIGSNRGKSDFGTTKDYEERYHFYDFVFSGCVSLKTVELPESTSSNGYNLEAGYFQNTGLTSIDIPKSVQEIASNAFAGTKLKNELHNKSGESYAIGIFGSDTKIYNDAFGDTYNNVRPEDVPKIGGKGYNSTACSFTVNKFGSEYFVDLGDYDPFHYPHTTEKIPGISATCQQTGLTEGERCTECGKIVTPQQETPKIEHTPVIIPGRAATEEQEGLTEGKKCSVCGEILVKQQTIPKLEHVHTPVTIPGRAATEEQEGLTEGKKCSACGEILVEQKTIPKLAHVHTPVTIPGRAATEEQEGLTEGKKCSACGEILVKQQTIPKLEHVHTRVKILAREATCTQEGLTEGEKCATCGEVLKPQVSTPKAAHNYQNGKCTVCGEDMQTKQILIGDVNGDGKITAADAMAIMRYSLGLKSSDEVGKTYTVR